MRNTRQLRKQFRWAVMAGAGVIFSVHAGTTPAAKIGTCNYAQMLVEVPGEAGPISKVAQDIHAMVDTGEPSRGAAAAPVKCDGKVKVGSQESPSLPLCVGRIHCDAENSGEGESRQLGHVSAEVICPAIPHASGAQVCPDVQECLKTSLLPNDLTKATFVPN